MKEAVEKLVEREESCCTTQFDTGLRDMSYREAVLLMLFKGTNLVAGESYAMIVMSKL